MTGRTDARVVIVTGSTRGIGRAIADHMAAGGWLCALNGRSPTGSRPAGEGWGGDVPGSGVPGGGDVGCGDDLYVRADVGDEADARRLVETVAARWGRVDSVVNNAAVTERIPHADLDAVDASLWARVLQVNLIGAWNVTRAAAPWLRKAEDGNVVNISSLAGRRAAGSCIPYAVSKAALDHLTRVLAAAMAPDVRVNAVAPGFIDNDRGDDRAAVRAGVTRRAPLRRPGKVEEVAEACAYLIGARYVTGEVLTVDGGLHVR